MAQAPSIPLWIQQQTVFITGGTGFVGQAVVYKLLECGCKKIYLFIRTKKNQDPEKRLDSLIDSLAFEQLRKNDPDLRKKVFAIAGEVGINGVTFLESDKKLLQDEITVVIHSAASVRFDDPLRLAATTNLIFTRDILEIAKTMKNLRIFHHVSTLYSNFDKPNIDEKIYEPKIDWRKLIEGVTHLDEMMINTLEIKLIGKSANTYIFTKHLAEAAVADAAKYIPIVVSRPPVVTNALRYPYPGWMSNMSSLVGITGAAGKGVLRIYYGDGDLPKSYAAVDSCSDTILASSYAHSDQRNERPPVYHLNCEPFSPCELKYFAMKSVERYPLTNIIWRPRFHVVNNGHLFLIAHVLFHFIPGLIFDVALKMANIPIRLSKIYRKIYVSFCFLIPLLQYKEKYSRSRILELKKTLSDSDNELFMLKHPDFDEESKLDVLSKGVRGLRIYLGEPPEPTKEDFTRMKILTALDTVVVALFWVLLFWKFPYQLVFNFALGFLDIFWPTA